MWQSCLLCALGTSLRGQVRQGRRFSPSASIGTLRLLTCAPYPGLSAAGRILFEASSSVSESSVSEDEQQQALEDLGSAVGLRSAVLGLVGLHCTLLLHGKDKRLPGCNTNKLRCCTSLPGSPLRHNNSGTELYVLHPSCAMQQAWGFGMRLTAAAALSGPPAAHASAPIDCRCCHRSSSASTLPCRVLCRVMTACARVSSGCCAVTRCQRRQRGHA